jgi:hypothetical protein
MSELPRTTTTGDPGKDVRSKGDGATQVPGDDLHHVEDDRLIANVNGVVEAWRERLRRGGRAREARMR